MTSPQAILTGAVLIAAAVYLSNGSEAVSAGASMRYVVAASQRVAYELDTETGAIRFCRATRAGDVRTVCGPWIER